VQRFRKKIEKDETFKESVVSLKPIVERCLKQNRTIDIYDF
jgi:dynein intermediate chain 2